MKPSHRYRNFFSGLFVIVAVLLMLPSLTEAQTNKKPSAPAPAPAKPAAAPKPAAAAPRAAAPAPRTNTSGTTGVHPGTTSAAGTHGTSTSTTTTTGRGTTGTAVTGARGTAGATGVHGTTTTTGRGATNTAIGAHGGTAGTAAAHGGAVAPHSLGAGAGRAPAVSHTVQTRSGNNVGLDKRGNVRTIQGHGMTINRGISGNRRVVTERNGQRFVSNGRRGGYAERPYRTYGGRSYYQRTYVYGGRSYARVYGQFGYRGGYYYRYYPTYYYQPVYYGWAYNPWPAPVSYGWGWGAAPWYGYYGAYFQPYPVYPYASLWLTDYLIAASLQAAYEAGQADAASTEELGALAYGGGYEPAGDSVSAAKLTPELKQQIADEVKAEIAAEKTAAAASTSTSAAPAAAGDEKPSALDPAFTIFVVSTDLDVSTDDGQDCTLSTGDVVERIDADAGTDNGVHVRVRAGKTTDCKVGSTPQVDLNDLQEMHNHFREQVDAGLENLAKNAGKNGLPAAPSTSTIGGAPPAPDASAAAQLQQQQKDADQAEAEAKQDASRPPQN